MPKVAAIFEIPTPYRHPVFERIARRSDLSVDFFFLSGGQSDRHWNEELFSGLKSTVLPGWHYSVSGLHTVHWNSGVRKALIDPGYDAYVIGGYSQPALWKLLRHCWRSRTPYAMVTESHIWKRRAPWTRWVKSSYLRTVYGRSKANLVAGTGAKEYVVHYGAPQDAIFLFPNSVDGPSYAELVDRERARREETRKRFGVAGKKLVLFVGFLGPVKGADILFSAFERIATDVPEIDLLWVGSGSMEGVLRDRTSRSGLGERVHFSGFLQPEELPELYAAADLLVLPSRHETFGAVICEAMAAGLPIVASRGVGAARDFVRPGENGYLVESDDVAGLGDAMKRVLVDPEGTKRMGVVSRRMMMEWPHSRLEESFVAAVNAALR